VPTSQRTVCDVAIVGAGPVGLFSVFTCGMMGLKAHVIDTLESLGGQCTALYPEKPIYDIPAFPSLTAGQLIENLTQQAAPFGPTYTLGQKVSKLVQTTNHTWLLETDQGTKIEAKAVIIAAGAGAFGPNRPPLEDIELFENTHVFYHVTHKERFRGKRVVIAGGGDSAVDWAILLADIASKVWVVHRRPQFRASPESLHQLKQCSDAGTIEMVIPYQLARLEGSDGALTAVHVRTLAGEERSLNADVLLPFFGLSYDLGPLATWNLTLEHKHIQTNPATCETNLPGIYAVGDIATYPHKRKLILCGFAEAAQAAQAIRSYLFPEHVFHFEYSTTSGIPKF